MQFNSENNFVKSVACAFEMSKKIGRKDFDALRPLLVKLLMKRNRDLFQKYLKSRGEAETSKTEIRDKNSSHNRRHIEKAFVEARGTASEQNIREEIAIQTEEKSPSEPEKYYEKKKVLEKRINEEKRSQIKWIENEIQHLNILRELLEKQNSPTHSKKKLSPHTITSSDDGKSKESFSKNAEEICPQAVTPVYGCTISLSENSPSEKNQLEDDNECRSKEKEVSAGQYKMAVSLTPDCSKNWKHVVMVPVGLQVSLNNSNNHLRNRNEENPSSFRRQISPTSDDSNMRMQPKPARFDVITQFPSVRNFFESKPSTSVQTNFPSTERLNRCGKECFCINLSDKSSLSASRSSKSKTSDKKDSPKLRFSNEPYSGTASENKTTNTTDPDMVHIENYEPSHADKKTGKSSEDDSFESSEALNKRKSSHRERAKSQKSCEKTESIGNQCRLVSSPSSKCKCQHCPEQLSASPSKPRQLCRCSCQSNIYLTNDKSSDDSRACRCSKIQVQKSSHGNCHIIKIHGSNCCSTKKSSCSCVRQSPTRKTEDQFCQTEPIQSTSEVKDVEKEPEKKTAEKLDELPESKPDEFHSKENKPRKETKELNTPTSSCSCKRRSEKRLIDDHPRHYFLKIEETEIDESIEAKEEKKSLEVITVTVPVKKAGKGKIYGSNIQQFRNNENSRSVAGPSSVKCSRCSDCRVPALDLNPQPSSSNRKNIAEKPDSTSDSRRPKPADDISYEDMIYYSSKDLLQRFSSSQEYCQERTGLPPSGSSFERAVDNRYEFQCCEGCNCNNRNIPSAREIQNEYDSHDTRRTTNAKLEIRRKHEKQIRARVDSERPLDDGILESRRLRPQSSDRNYPDYYNYNRREFMTKSELIREEKQKRREKHQSLQECLSSNRPDFCSSAERRREIINRRAEERAQRHNNRMECLLKLMQKCNEESGEEPRRMFTTVQMREQTMKRYRKLPEVTGKIADQKKKEEYRTNRLMADIFAKKLQIEALKGHLNLSNHFSVLHTI